MLQGAVLFRQRCSKPALRHRRPTQAPGYPGSAGFPGYARSRMPATAAQRAGLPPSGGSLFPVLPAPAAERGRG